MSPPSWRTPLAIAAWPAAYRERFELAREGAGRFSLRLRRRRWRARTWEMAEAECGRWLSYVHHRELLDISAAPDTLITPERVERYRAAMAERCRDATIVIRIDGLADAAAILAPTIDWSWLKAGARELRADIRNVKPKLERIRPIRQLLGLGVHLMAEAETLGWSPARAAVRYRDGLMIALLAARPVRRENLARLRLGSSLIRRDDGWWIELAGADTKTGRRDRKPLPKALAGPLEVYLERHRPLLLGTGQDDHLWLTLNGDPVRAHVVFKQISVLTRQRLGVAINPHAFRHAATTSIALDDSHRIDIAAHVLGHAGGTKTMQAHYNLARDFAAAQQWQAEVRRLRGRQEPRRRRNPEGGA